MKSTFKEKLLLIVLGIVLGFGFLEIGLRVAGAIVLSLQERHNHVSFASNEYRILCLGESTTALGGEDSYPSQLEGMLNAKDPAKKFMVINKGIISTTTSYILAHIDENLDRYKPQLVIIMMGINDKAYLHHVYKNLGWENFKANLKDFRVYKLIHLLYQRIKYHHKRDMGPMSSDSGEDNKDPQTEENAFKMIISQCIQRFSQHMVMAGQYQQKGQMNQAQHEKQTAAAALNEASLLSIELAIRYRTENSFEQAQDTLKQALDFHLNLPEITQAWAELYLAQGKSDEAINAFQREIDLEPQKTDVLPFLARAYHQEHKDAAFIIYAQYLQMKPKDYWGHLELAGWLAQDKHLQASQAYLVRAVGIEPTFAQAYEDLGQLYEDEGQNNLAREYFEKAALRTMTRYYPVTLVNYNLLLDKILKRHIKAIVMQYPMEDITALKNYLGPRQGLSYVENKQNFKHALAQGGYWRYFKDTFAANFGHCTREGNQLIAQNLSGVILNHE